MLFPAVAIAQQTAHDHAPKFDEIAAALGVKPGGKVADVGAGSGDYTFKLAAAVGPEGRVWAVDVAKSALRQLRRKVEEGKAGNVEVVEGKEDDPLLPKGELDAVLVVDAYHEMEEHRRMLGHMRDALKPGGRLVIVEHMPGTALLGKPRIEQQDRHSLSPAFVEADLAEAGLERVKTTVAPETEHGGRYMVVARKN
jgi:ubiquinone/menaquinone biosynthesis C-methylase UbiE